MEQTNSYSYTYFKICSNCEFIKTSENIGYYESTKAGEFDPDDITKILEIEPFEKWKKGDQRSPLHPKKLPYSFSLWNAEKSDIDRIDTGKQCLETIKNLINKIPELLKIKSLYDVVFQIVIVPYIYSEKVRLYFEKEIIDFCYFTGTTIDVDMYINSDISMIEALKQS
jgi:hypothetical protein